MFCSKVVAHGDPMKEYKQLLFPKNSPNRDMFNRGILKLRETGTMNLILSEWLSRTHLDNSGQGETTPLGIRKTISSLAILMAAYLIAFAILTCEKLWAALSKKIINHKSTTWRNLGAST